MYMIDAHDEIEMKEEEKISNCRRSGMGAREAPRNKTKWRIMHLTTTARQSFVDGDRCKVAVTIDEMLAVRHSSDVNEDETAFIEECKNKSNNSERKERKSDAAFSSP